MNAFVRAAAAVIGCIGFAVTAQAATYVVSAKNLSFDPALVRKIEAAGGTITSRLPQIGVAFVESGDSTFAARAAKAPGIRSVVADLEFTVPESDGVVAESFSPPGHSNDDTRYDLQWGSAAIDVAGAWNQGYRGKGAIVAVLDSGVACQHADIAPNLLPDSASFVPGEAVCQIRYGRFSHGTHVAGIVAAADNGVGSIGVAPEAKILAVKVLSGVGGGSSFGNVISGIVYAADHGADVINLSLGIPNMVFNGRNANDVAELVNATKRAIQYAREQNAITIAAAGNDATDLDHNSGVEICDLGGCYRANLRAFPAQLPNVLAISATTPVGWAFNTAGNLDHLASYSNYGQSAIALAAPGGDTPLAATPQGRVPCTVRQFAYECYSFDMVVAPGGITDYGRSQWFFSGGTSMAAPHVAGVAALIIGKHGGEMAPAEVERILRASADDLGKPGNDDAYGGGRVNAARAVTY